MIRKTKILFIWLNKKKLSSTDFKKMLNRLFSSYIF